MVWKVYGDPMGVKVGFLYEVWEVYGHGDPMGVIGGRSYEFWEVFGYPKGIIGLPSLTGGHLSGFRKWPTKLPPNVTHCENVTHC